MPAAAPFLPPFASPAQAAERLTLLLESTGEGIFGIDLEGHCTFVNRAAAQMLGWRPEMVLGRNMHALMHHTHADGRHYPECDCPIFRAFRQGQPCRIDGEVLWRADGSCFPAEYSSYPVVEDGQVRGAVATFVDITERKRAEELLKKSHEELEQRVAERTRELRDLANHLEAMRETERKRIAREIHDELGSLLVALKMDTQWLHRRVGTETAARVELQAKCQGMGRLIDTAVDNLGRIITDLRPSILDHSGLWAALEWQAQEFIDAFSGGGDENAPGEREATLQCHVAAGVPPPQGGQAIAIFRIFQELLTNVARHAQARCVRISLHVDGPPDAVLYLDVRDDGIGAAPEALADPQSFGVLGMRERAGHLGGRLTIDSAPGQGTRARLVMPLADQASDAV
jgi:PAS domain S-box-containing protein